MQRFPNRGGGDVSCLQSTNGDEFDSFASIANPSVIGELATELPQGAPDRWHYPLDVQVQLFGGGLSSAYRLSVLNGANMAAIKTPSGEWEIVQFQDAALIGDKLYRLDGLLRGQAGTDAFIGSPTPAGAAFVLLGASQSAANLAAAHRGLELRYRIGPARKHHSHESYREFSSAFNAVGLRPYAPAHAKAVVEDNGDLSISWIRRARLDGDNWQSIEPPLGETREAYLIEISGEDGLLRRSEASDTSFVYTQAAQTADQANGALVISISQISDQFGPGPATKVIAHV